jgi:hypothetical protein
MIIVYNLRDTGLAYHLVEALAVSPPQPLQGCCAIADSSHDCDDAVGEEGLRPAVYACSYRKALESSRL